MLRSPVCWLPSYANTLPDALKGFVESGNLSPLPGGTGSSEDFLNNDGTEVGERNVLHIAWSKRCSEGGVSKNGNIDTRVEKQGVVTGLPICLESQELCLLPDQTLA
jgi:hypothetical protein